ncbi:hemicentin-1-like [Pecten maximus]|uniref:hemicentin-1-like n=1 Tax=Pecten maximus TaxID=6579 RepID=UPI001458F340|nr:hemicentin-1-like [Pecten maximus]
MSVLKCCKCWISLLAILSIISVHDVNSQPVTRGQVPNGAASLAFVFDITGSMYDDLVQVIVGAENILKETQKRREKPLYDYVLVPFHDPQVGPVLVTTNPEYFKETLKDLYVQGGGDCPEMSITAISEALDVSLPNSFIYVFTDARARDFNLTDIVLAQIQEKQSQVVFVLTGDCGDPTHEGYKAYEKIASTSSGQVFLLRKNQVNQVLNFVKVAVQARKVNLMSIDVPEATAQMYELPIDSKLQEITVSVSGETPEIELRGPDDRKLTVFSGLNDLLDLRNAKVVNVKAPTAGQWKLFIASNSAHTIRVTGLSTTDFVSGFSRFPTNEIAETELRPLGGVPTFMVINASSLEAPGRFNRLELIDLQGNILKIQDLVQDQDRPYIYTLTKPIPASKTLSGIDDKRNPMYRLTPTAISPVPPPRPNVYMPPVTRGFYDATAYITCSVQSPIQYNVQWSRGNQPIGNALFYRESSNVVLELPYVDGNSEGSYTCNATNLAGWNASTTYLDVSEPPPVIDAMRNSSVLPGQDAILHCLVQSTVEYNISWYQPNSVEFLSNSNKYQIFNNGSLLIRNIGIEDEGRYLCLAGNEGGFTEALVHVRVQVPPKAVVTPAVKNFKTGQTVNLTCTAEGFPVPNFYWLRDNKLMIPNERINIDGPYISFANMFLGDQGQYQCLAENLAGEDTVTATLTYIEAPQIYRSDELVLVASGDMAVLVCAANGIPSPKITWFRGDVQLRQLSYVNITDDGVLMILGTQQQDGGQYRCVATNEAGTDSADVTLEVGSEPRIITQPTNLGADIGTNVTINCEAAGHPPPKIYWRNKEGTIIAYGGRYNQLPTGSLSITNLKIGDEGRYTCVVQNQFGMRDISAYLTVTGIVRPCVELNCVLLRGNPKPLLNWIKDGMVVQPSTRVTRPFNSTVLIGDIQRDMEGDYQCVASNVAGNSTYTVTVDVLVPPMLRIDDETDVLDRFSVIEGDSIFLPCNVDGDPPPSFTWLKDGSEILLTDPSYYITEDGTLEIFGAEASSRGTYTCVASNVAGEVEKTVTLFVEVPPAIEGQLNEKYVVEAGDVVLLPCVVSGVPEPEVNWRRNFVPFYADTERFLISDQGLNIAPALIVDKAIYECVATNDAGSASKVITLIVQIPPQISLEGDDEITVLRTEGVTLNCEATGNPTPVVRWTKDGVTLDISDSSYYQLIGNGSLRILSAGLEDSGLYMCVVTNTAGTETKEFFVTINALPTLPNNLPKNTSAIENSDVILECPAKGTPFPEITWYKDDVKLSSNDFGVNILPDGSLQLKSISAQDTGEYRCLAINVAGEVDHTTKLKVLVAPKVIGGDRGDIPIPESHTVRANETLTMYCTVEADPAPTIEWLKNGEPFTEEELSHVRISLNGKELVIPRASVEDTALYTCVATNIAGSSQKEFDVDVHVPPTIDPGTVSNGTLSVKVQQTLTINCPVNGIPLPQISWFKDEQYISPILDANIKLYAGGRRLEVLNARITDAGRYKCVGENIAGSTQHEFDVKVNVPPQIEHSDVLVIPEVVENGDLQLNCPASGKPTPKITWFRENQPIKFNSSRYLLLNDGFTLQILDAQQDDATRFICRAENVAGANEKAFDVDVLVPARISSDNLDPTPDVVLNRTLLLNCPAEGNPIPEITWYKDGFILDTSLNPRYDILSGGRQLRIQAVRLSDTAIYRCEAINKAGESSFEFNTDIFVPSKIPITNININPKAVVNSSLTLNCPAKGTPTPEITWFKDGREITPELYPNIRIKNNGLQLEIINSQVSNTGTYRCRAVNPAGQSELVLNVNIQVPAKISSDVDTDPRVIIGEPATIYCPASGTPAPKIRWFKNGSPIILSEDRQDIRVTAGGRELYILAAEVDDAGSYTCVATNEAGEAEETFNLEVYVPPQIDHTFDEITKVIRGRTTVLNCPANGIPLPNIEWQKNGRVMIFTDRVVVLDGGRQLKITNSTDSDRGLYRCIATNRAGRDAADMELVVLVPPDIDESNTVYTPRVVVNRTVLLECAVSGVPTPTVQWFLNDRPIRQTNRIRLLASNKQLQIERAQTSDSNTYTCQATNEAGQLRKNFQLMILVPPLLNKSVNTNFTVKENGNIVIQCPVLGGIPDPSVFWLKDRVPLNNFPYQNLNVTNRNRRLEIRNAKVVDAVQYTCQARNSAGEDSMNFYLRVFVRPSITNESERPTFTVLEGEQVTLECPVTGIPDPGIQWQKDGRVIELSQNSHMSIIAGGQVLRILSARVGDTAQYMCHAENEAGFAEKFFQVNINVRPRINGSQVLQEKSVILGNDLSLHCPTLGIPPPEISWYWQGGLVAHESRFFQILDRGETLLLNDADRPQEGFYTCVATNPAGSTSLNFTVTVLVPPMITDSVTDVTGVVDTSVVLPCEFGGYPDPKVTWKKDGYPFPLSSLRHQVSFGAIQFSRVRLEDQGIYECMVTNLVGNDTKRINLTLQVPPGIIGPRDLRIEVLVGNDAFLPCDAVGQPEPEISWSKGFHTQLKRNQVILANGTLHVRSVARKDGGVYRCTAANSVDLAYRIVRLRPLIRPSILVGQVYYNAHLGDKVVLPCRVTASPRAKIVWRKDGQLIDITQSRFFKHGNRLVIASTRSVDSGNYTCTAANQAGIATVYRNLTVIVPPFIKESSRLVTAFLGNLSFIVPCEVTGYPEPDISWYKDGRRLEDDRNRIIFQTSGSLMIRGVQRQDAGIYRCYAINSAGNSSRETTVRIQEAPIITLRPQGLEVAVGGSIQLLCGANGVPSPIIRWEKNGLPVEDKQNIGGRSLLIVNSARREDGGLYTCIAENPAGIDTASATVLMSVPPRVTVPDGNAVVSIAEKVMLTCSVGGDPQPNIYWTKNGRPVIYNERIILLLNGSLVIYQATSSDAGEYKCVATNDAGTSTGVAMLIVNEPPQFKIEPKNTTVSMGDTIVMNCVAEGEPEPLIAWQRSWQDIEPDERLTILPNNSLRIIAAQVLDSGKVQCKASNREGITVVEAYITVVVHGRYSEWSEWGMCSSTCGIGIQFRARTCTDPEPVNGGRKCIGSSLDSRTCIMASCPVNGEWGNWQGWTECSATCGEGERFRTRFCDNPTPRDGGLNCQGDDIQYDVCGSRPCPLDGQWGEWSGWRPCSVTCGVGSQERTRRCDSPSPAYRGQPCPGETLDRRPCTAPTCEVDGNWGLWALWSGCSQSCGGGTRTRQRSCDSPAPQFGGMFCWGRDRQVDYCNPEKCPRHGNWEQWESWGACSASCGTGLMKRFRTCTNPPPSRNGRPCLGSGEMTKTCNTILCPVNGEWRDWSNWTPCSVTCGEGYRERQRQCSNPRHGGSSCQGNTIQRDDCVLPACSNFPRRAEGNLVGYINNIDLPDATLSATIIPTDSGTTLVEATLHNVPQSIAGHLRHLVDILNPVFWTTALEVDGAKNGLTLANGHFVREVQVQYVTGETLTMSQFGRGVDDNGILQVDVMLRGNAPNLTSVGDVYLLPYHEQYIQTGHDSMYAHSTRVFRVDGLTLPYAWNHTITYNEDLGMMPYLVQDMYVRDISTFSPTPTEVEFRISTSISPGTPSNQCPDGFYLDTDGQYCRDIDECTTTRPCSSYCHNSPGTYACSCPFGYVLDRDGSNCQDINECANNNGGCSVEQECINTLGSFHCAVYCDNGFRRSLDNQFCDDIDECHETPEVCGQNCDNIPGGYQCSCSRGFMLVENGRCTDINECANNNGGCSVEQECINTLGSFHCAVYCDNGFRRSLDDQFCDDIDECHETPEVCGQNCDNIPGGYQCSCSRGFMLVENGRCTDVNECTHGTSGCSHNCKNSIGSYKCACPSGFRLQDLHTCIDINECSEGVSRCRNDEKCVNSDGSYNCIRLCPDGYEPFAPGQCRDIDECRGNLHQCYANQRCVNTEGSYQCTCDPGFTSRGQGHPCIDVDECVDQPGVCTFRCQNTFGGFECICPPGQIRLADRKSCAGLEFIEPSQVFSVNIPTQQRWQPQNDMGAPRTGVPPCRIGYHCSTLYRHALRQRHKRGVCPLGMRYVPSQHTCLDVDECTEDPGICQHKCINTEGSFKCTCPKGYKVSRNGRKCIDVNECSELRIDCGPDQMCFNTRGSHHCIQTPCPLNYKRNPQSGYCVLECSMSDVPCPPGARYADVIEFRTVALPSGILAYQDLIRLIAFDQNDVQLPKTDFTILRNDINVNFEIRLEDGTGIVYPLSRLEETELYKITVRAKSYDNEREYIQYQTTFIIHISVSAFPY